jgi:hypothetical protein
VAAWPGRRGTEPAWRLTREPAEAARLLTGEPVLLLTGKPGLLAAEASRLPAEAPWLPAGASRLAAGAPRLAAGAPRPLAGEAPWLAAEAPWLAAEASRLPAARRLLTGESLGLLTGESLRLAAGEARLAGRASRLLVASVTGAHAVAAGVAPGGVVAGLSVARIAGRLAAWRGISGIVRPPVWPAARREPGMLLVARGPVVGAATRTAARDPGRGTGTV